MHTNPLPLIRSLALAYQAFEAYAAEHVKASGLTLTQFDVIATLGNQPPMTCKALGERTLILKATLTGVLERLEAKRLIQKIPNETDGRSYRVGLTGEGDRLFQSVFPDHVVHLARALSTFKGKRLEARCVELSSLQSAFSSQPSKSKESP